MHLRKVRLTIILITLALTFLQFENVTSNLSAHGIVTDNAGNPIPDTLVIFYKSLNDQTNVITDENGTFSANVDFNSFIIQALTSINDTSTHNYFRYTREITNYNGEFLEIVLIPCATILVEDNFRFIYTDETPSSIIISVIEPVNHNVIETLNRGHLIYHKSDRSSNCEVKVPTETPFKLMFEYARARTMNMI